MGNLEVRTTQVSSEQEAIGAVFTVGSPGEQAGQSTGSQNLNSMKVLKVTEYVEMATDAVTGFEALRSFVVFGMEDGRLILTERLPNGVVTWQENPTDLESRSAIAKVVRSSDCNKHSIALGSIKDFQAQDASCTTTFCLSLTKYYAQRIYNFAIKADNAAYTGFRKPEHSKKWQLSETKYGLYAISGKSSDIDKDVEAEEVEAESKDGKRLGIGEKVQIKGSGRQGTITADDSSAVPYQV